MKSPLASINSRELRDVLRDFIDEHEMRLERMGSGHFRLLTREGKLVTIVSATASDRRAALNARSCIRRFMRSEAA
jgi:hypothetical protein